jgi:signal recognition particle receptor subunit alpha
MKGGIRDLEADSDTESSADEDFETAAQRKQKAEAKGRGFFAKFREWVGEKNITHEMMVPILEKLRDHLIAKNVAADIAQKLCDSVAKKLEGKVRMAVENGTRDGIVHKIHMCVLRLSN